MGQKPIPLERIDARLFEAWVTAR